MDINLLVVSVGNSRLAVGAFVGGELRNVGGADISRPQDWPAILSSAWAQVGSLDLPAVAGASSNPAAEAEVEKAVFDATGQGTKWVGKEISLPFAVLTDQPEQTGVDRVLNVAAAYEQMQKACVVVDAGTAITIDLCNDKGEFLGGAIAPGATTMLSILRARLPHLPEVELAAPAAPFGKNTRQAMLHGVYHGIRGMVKEIVENYATDLGTWPDVIATGGDAKLLFADWELIHAISPDLTLYGVALAYADYQIRRGD